MTKSHAMLDASSHDDMSVIGSTRPKASPCSSIHYYNLNETLGVTLFIYLRRHCPYKVL